MTNIHTPGNAMDYTMEILRIEGYSTDNVESKTAGPGYQVTGQLQSLTDGSYRGSFKAMIEVNGDYAIYSSAFGKLSSEGDDPFEGL